jgi:hypothetical protein
MNIEIKNKKSNNGIINIQIFNTDQYEEETVDVTAYLDIANYSETLINDIPPDKQIEYVLKMIKLNNIQDWLWFYYYGYNNESDIDKIFGEIKSQVTELVNQFPDVLVMESNKNSE